MKKPIQQVQGKQFYSHLVKIESLVVQLHSMNLSDSEKAHLVALIDSSLHHTILDAILSELSEEDKKLFLSHVATDAHDKTWKLLNEKVDKIEEKIQKSADLLTRQLREDIKTSKEK